MVEVGQTAPDFTLTSSDFQEVTLSQLRGRSVVLVFVPMAFSPTCEGEFCALRDSLHDYAQLEAQVFGISVDSKWVLKAWAAQQRFGFGLLADFHPKGEVSKAYGAYIEERGHNQRALVMIGPDLAVTWTHQSPSPLEIPGANLIFDALERQAA